MRSNLIAALCAFGSLSAVSALPCGTSCNHGSDCSCSQDAPLASAPAPNPLEGSECNVDGQFSCIGNDIAQCSTNSGLHVIKCPDGTACVPNDWECVSFLPNSASLGYSSEWDRVNAQVNGNAQLSASAPVENPLNGTPCDNHGEYSCVEGGVAVCNWGSLVVTPCGENLYCSADFECVPQESLASIASQFGASSTSDCGCDD